MIRVTRLDGQEILINPDLVESIEATPETVLTLVGDRKLVVRESPQEVAERVMAYRQQVARGAVRPSAPTVSEVQA